MMDKCGAKASDPYWPDHRCGLPKDWPFPPVVKKPLPRTHYSWLKIAKKRLADRIYSATHREQINARIRALRKKRNFVVQEQRFVQSLER